MKKLNIKIITLVSLFFLFLCPLGVYAAGGASTGFKGNSTVYEGATFDITLYVNEKGSNGGLAAFGGRLKYDSSKLTLVSAKSLAPFNVDINKATNKLGGFSSGSAYITGYSNIMRFTFKATALGKTTVSFQAEDQPDKEQGTVNITSSSKTITVTEPPSSNNNLSSLSTNKGSISFNKNTTKYTLNVANDVSSITITAQAEDSGALVSGVGTKSLVYGNNTIKVVVTAANGDKKTYTIIVNRKDNRSSNNKLSSLSVKEGSLNPKFYANTESYKMNVPFSVTEVHVKAVADDSKSKISISGATGLIAEKNNVVTIKVTAENGSVKNYIINVTRGKDPNKKLSTNNNLADLNVNVGILSPSFSKDKTNYAVYLPFEIDKIDINALVEDTKYGVLNVDAPTKLNVGNNKFTYTVTAEDNSTKVYTINVVRASNLEDTSSGNASLKNIKLTNGRLIGTFKNNIFVYSYKKGKNFEFEAIPEDENSKVTTNITEDIITILVEAPNGESNVYILLPKKANILLITVIVILILLIILSAYLGYQKGIKRNLKN